jgi:hypothetical protein
LLRSFDLVGEEEDHLAFLVQAKTVAPNLGQEEQAPLMGDQAAAVAADLKQQGEGEVVWIS